MSAIQFHLDAHGHVCGGSAVTDHRSDEAWKLTACPVKSLEDCGVEIAWPDGEVWTHDHIAQAFPEQERAA